MQLNLGTKKNFSEANMRRIISILTGLMSSVSSLEDQCIKEYNDTVTYQKGQIVIGSDGYFYEAKTVATGTWDASKWTKIGTDEFTELDVDTIKSYLNLTQEQITNLQSLIDDTTITTTKTNSSSKIYMDIQAAIAECKDDTLKQIAKKVSGSYKIATSTAEVTSADYIYLISNGSNYDLYVLVDSVPTKVGDTSIDLSDYAKLTDLDNYYDKATSDGKFATITTVDGKVDKTDIVDNLTSIDTDKPLSANQGKVLKDEVDLKANDSDVVKKIDIVTTIDGTSTDEQIYSAKGIYDSLINKVDNPIILSTADEVNSFDMAYQSFIIEPSVAEAVGLPKTPDSTWFCINLSHFKGFKYPSQIAFEYAGIERIMYRTAHNGVWHNWRKIPTTSVADVPKTVISSSNSDITLGSNSCYSVVNGICYVTIWEFKGLTVSRDVAVATGMPKPKQITGTSIINAIGSGDNVAFIYVDDSNSLCVNTLTTNVYGYGSFSYPVAE